MKNISLKNHIEDYYNQQEMSDLRMQALLDIQMLEEVKSEKKAQKQIKLGNYLIIPTWPAVAFVFFILFFLAGIWIKNDIYYRNINLEIAKEISLNHLKDLQPDYVESNINNLQTNMPKLDFNLINSKSLKLLNAKLIGARYCSIQGNIAAQLKYRDNKNQIVTLYQTKADQISKEISPGNYRKGNIQIKLWIEGDVLFGLAQNIE